MSFIVDVSDPAQVQDMVSSVEKQWGRIDILLNNAGITQPVRVIDMTPEDWERVFKTNMKGVFTFSKAVVPVMLKRNYGRIVNMSSVSGKRGGGLFGALITRLPRRAFSALPKPWRAKSPPME